ncbi:uncharacterized protein V1516DRAFT_619030 [Lipomyces oligophaga]|uniref:uncharacterized protein n=1 Tax=Lipomyces oligophaga TaxID=45792 RepID=UPI0034CFF6D3
MDVDGGVAELTLENERSDRDAGQSEIEPTLTDQDLERFGELLETVLITPYKYNAHIELLKLLSRPGAKALADELREERKRVSDLFLMDEQFWSDWLDDESVSRSEPEDLDLEQLHERSTKDLLSIKLWKRYIQYVESIGHDISTVIANAVSATEYSVPDSHQIWDIYCGNKLEMLRTDPTEENLALIKRTYLSRLKIPHSKLEDTFAAYSSFVTQYLNHTYETELIAANKIVAQTRRTLSDFQVYEDHLSIYPNDTNVWAQYIDAATSRPKKQFSADFVKALYERTLRISPTSVAIWDNYVLFLLDNQYASSVLESVLERSVKACPKSGVLWAHWIRTRDRFGVSHTAIEELKMKAIISEQLDTDPTEYGYVIAAWIAHMRVWCNNTSVKEEYYRAVEEEYSLFETKFPSKFRKDPTYLLPQLYLTTLASRGMIEKGRLVWDGLTSKHARESDFWLGRFSWEKSVCFPQGDFLTPASILTSALAIKSMDFPERICDALQVFELDYGSAFTIENAAVRIKKCLRALQRRRALEALQADNVPEKKVVALVTDPDVPQNGTKRKEISDGEETNAKKTKLSEATRDREHSTILAENLPSGITEEEISRFFKDCGEIKTIKIVETAEAATATIEFDTIQDVLSAQTRDQKRIRDREITVRAAVDTTLWITNFPSTADETYIRGIFDKFGKIVEIRFPSLSVNNKRRFCYLQYSTSDSAHRAAQEMHDRPAPPPVDGNVEEYKSRRLVVKISDPSQRQSRHGAVYEGRELFVRNIPTSIKEQGLRELFGRYGKIERVNLPSKDELFHTHQGFGFIAFESVESAQSALKLDQTQVGGDKALSVVVADSKGHTSNRAGHGGRGQSRAFGFGRGRGRPVVSSNSNLGPHRRM